MIPSNCLPPIRTQVVAWLAVCGFEQPRALPLGNSNDSAPSTLQHSILTFAANAAMIITMAKIIIVAKIKT